MTNKEFINELKKINIKITNDQLKKLDEYASFLLEYNKHTNLTAINTKEEIYLKHFYDSLTITTIIELTNQKLLDIGTGAGFPGLVLAIMFPNLKVTLLDSNNKKITFLNKCLQKLQLKNVTIINKRAEEYSKNNQEQFDCITTRAVAHLRIISELAIPALKINGIFIAMKGNITNELEESLITIQKLNSQIIAQKEFDLPNNTGHRTLIKIQKILPTPNIYPRKYDKIKKYPLNNNN